MDAIITTQLNPMNSTKLASSFVVAYYNKWTDLLKHNDAVAFPFTETKS